MNKKYLILSVLFFMIFFTGISQIYAATPKINGKQYIAMASIDKDTGEYEINGDILVPFHLYMGYNKSNNTCYGSFVRPHRISATDGFGLEHLALARGVLKTAKKIVFNLVKEDKTVYKKIRAIIRKNGKYLIVKLPDVKGKRQNVEFHFLDADRCGVFIDDLPNVATLDNGSAKKGNTIAGIRIITDKDAILPDPTKDRVTVATTGMFEGSWWTTSFEADLIKNGPIYSALLNTNYFEFEQEAQNKQRFIYQNDQFNRRGYMTNMGGNGKSPHLNNHDVNKISSRFVKIKFNDPDGIHFGFYAELIVKNPKKIWITETGRNPDNDYAYVILQKKAAFGGQIGIKVTNPDGTSSQINVNIPK